MGPKLASRRTTRCDFGKMSWPWCRKHHLGIERGNVASKLIIEAIKNGSIQHAKMTGLLLVDRHLMAPAHLMQTDAPIQERVNYLLLGSMQMLTFEPNLRQFCWHSWDCGSVLKHVLICCLQGKVVKFQSGYGKRWQRSRNLLIQPTAHRQRCWLMSLQPSRTHDSSA